jgi:hypothetical protein
MLEEAKGRLRDARWSRNKNIIFAVHAIILSDKFHNLIFASPQNNHIFPRKNAQKYA